MEVLVIVPSVVLSLCFAVIAAPVALFDGQGKPVQGPETFTANAQVKGAAGAAATTLRIQVDRYTPDFDRKSVEDALKTGGYPKFLTALRQAPVVGSVSMGDQQFAIRFARQQPTPKGRTISIVTDTPIFFVGGGATNAKPRAGYEVAVLHFSVDEVGLGSGTMAAAARVRPGGETGVQIDDYGSEPIDLVTVSKVIK
jgi:hypothetical protein